MGRPRSSKTVVGKHFDAEKSPIFFLDSRRRIAYCNPACATWLGFASEEDLIGRRCDYHSKPDANESDSKLAALCPPPQAFNGVERVDAIDNGTESLLVRFLPIFDQEQDGFCVLGVPCHGSSSESENVGNHQGSELHHQIRQVRRSLKTLYSIDRLVGQSREMQLVRRQITAAATSHSNALVLGASGSGRESVARVIHYAAEDSEHRSLLPLACELLDADLLESMLDSFSQQASEQSDARSTLLLLNIDMLCPSGQTTLAKFLNSRKELQAIATAKALPAEANESDTSQLPNSLRSLLATVTIRIPRLRDRLSDLPVLIQSAIEEQNAMGGKQIGQASSAALDAMAAHHWPGELEELFEIVRSAHASAAGTTIEKKDLPEILELARDAEMHPRLEPEKIDLDQFLANAESELIRRALRHSKGNKTQAAALLGINRARLLRRIEQLSID